MGERADGIHESDTAATIEPALLDRLLDEAATLGEAARDALLAPKVSGGDALEALRTQHEIGVIATCLGYCVAWLLEQKAVAAGEIVRASPPPLRAELERPRPDPLAVDPFVADIGERTRAFGARIERLAAA